MNASRETTLRLLVVALAGVCLVFAFAACSGDGPESAGPVPTVPVETEPSASAGSAASRASRRVGFIGLPPEGTTPSTPERGDLVISFFGAAPAKIIWTDRKWGTSNAWVYADGRLIWEREDDRPYGANHISTGLLEQRLTPDGVELFRSELMATGLFARDGRELRIGGYPTVHVGDGDRFVTHGGLSARDGRRLTGLFADPASWLPARAWEDREIRAYVPSRFAVCYGVPGQSIEPSRMLSLLPVPAQDLLRARRTEPSRSFGDFLRACSDMTTEEARTVAGAFDDAGLERSGGPKPQPPRADILAYRLEVPGAREVAQIWFLPVLPHGEWTCTCGG